MNSFQNGKTMQTKLIQVTPKLASQWLQTRREGQRPVRERVVEKYASDMEAGAWSLTHQGLAFGNGGELLDGQHRLEAIVRSGCTVNMMVTTDVDDAAFVKMDQGATRTIGNQLGRSNQWVGLVVQLWRMEVAQVRNHVAPSVVTVQSVYAHAADAVDFAAEQITPRVLPGVAAGVLAYAYPVDPAGVTAIAKRLRDGADLRQGSPELAWRNWYRARSRTARPDITFATCGAIRASLLGEDLTKIHTGETGYKWITTRRRALRIPHTPTPDQVSSQS